jgi:hypothetical protein
MSIKTIGSNVTSNSIGIEKKINKGAERLVFDILQATQYSTPISSTVRELATNALDAQREKEIAVLKAGKAANYWKGLLTGLGTGAALVLGLTVL